MTTPNITAWLTAAVPILGVGLLCYFSLWLAYTLFFHPLRNIPGPFSATLSRYWLVSNTMRGNMDHVQRALHEKYGPLVRIAPDEVACSDPQAIRTIYSTQNPLSKTDFYPCFGNNDFTKWTDNFTEVDERVHFQRRRIVNNIYSLSNVLQCETYIDKCSLLFMSQLDRFAETNETLNLGEWLQWYAFDVIGELYFGRMFGFMENCHDYESYISSTEKIFPFLCMSALSPAYWRPFILGSAMFSSENRRAAQAFQSIIQAAKKCTKDRVERSKEQSGGRDFLQQLMDLVQRKGSQVDFGYGDVQQEAFLALGAGSDTTAIALRAIFYYLLKSPRDYQRLQKEIDDAATSGQLSNTVRYEEAARLPFLSACIKEGMRLHPSVALTMPRTTPRGGIEVAGRYIPQGYKIGMNAAVVHYDKSVFGTDSYQFRPDRWLEDGAQYMERATLTFGAGTRTCIGKNISLCEIYKVIPQILKTYNLELTHDAVWKTYNFWFHRQEGLKVHIRRR